MVDVNLYGSISPPHPPAVAVDAPDHRLFPRLFPGM